MYKIVLLRHGESEWNALNLFTGWTDVDLTEQGIKESKNAAKIFLKRGYTFDIIFTSVLKRCIKTAWIILDEMDAMWVPIKRSWKLNERFDGDLQGKNKVEMAKKYGEEQVFLWRRGWDNPAQPIPESDPRHPINHRKYQTLKKEEIPSIESLKDVEKRVKSYWLKEIVPEIIKGEKVLIIAHGNSLRALIKDLNDISPEKLSQINIPSGIPCVYELNNELKTIRSYYLGDPSEIQNAIQLMVDAHKFTKEN
ncbi:2,3-diphosphoglycerate-dependent phosphoglycerate mutase [Promethearchaeum syntrophicum]|uniref:2,3-bisphosphoglycerate-dependent phosphoglycerate mutase n=1 Tax=Promethearchaeum syntrophicum TaxID=2594042 RepID=A0A5B9DD95_9ARCH|nr:2,3-diphosphoglycerate-dependent phosphoglycerate mutase [Candidatus Prometheoarchaeum syntrophicum]QEE17092.1 phosphoglyceromutase [Candidatus Prometheoarchaeum syntrophicum]